MSNLSDLITNTATNVSPAATYKNILINGDFSITQQGKSKSGLVGYEFVDMWKTWAASGTHDCSIEDVSLPNGRQTNMMVLTGTDIYALTTSIEYAFKILHNKTFTLSFWAKADTNSNVAIGNLRDVTQSENAYPGSSVTLTTTWQKFTKTYLATDYSTRLNSEHCILYPFYGLDGDNTFYIADIQLEEGAKATNFEERPITIENELCSRYYYSTLVNSINCHTILGKAITVERVGQSALYPTEMRISPVVNIYSDDNETLGKVTQYNGIIDIGSGFIGGSITANGFLYVKDGSSLVIGNQYVFKYTADARL